MRTSVVLGLVFSIPSQETGLWKRLRNYLFCVEWDVKPQLHHSVSQSFSELTVVVIELISLSATFHIVEWACQ